MKISIVGPGFSAIPPKGWGAVESLIWDIRNALISLGHEVDIVNTTNCVIGTNKLSLFANKVGARTNAKLG